MARNDTTNRPNLPNRTNFDKTARYTVCPNCAEQMELVGNRLFLIYKRARLPQPKSDAQVCLRCNWVEGDAQFQALIEERMNHR